MSNLHPYISYENTLEALEYYKDFFKATDVERIPLGKEQAQGLNIQPEKAFDHTVHASFKVQGNTIMCSDRLNPNGNWGPFSDSMIIMLESNSLDKNSEKDMEDLYKSIIRDDQVKIEMELAEQFWGGKMAKLVDRYGVVWMFHSQPKKTK